MYSGRKSVFLTLSAAALGAVLIATLRWRSTDSASTSLHPAAESSPTPPGAAFPAALPDRRFDVELTDSDASAAPARNSNSGADVLRQAEVCLRPDLDDPTAVEADLRPIWECLQSLDWLRVGPADLGTWLCADKRSLKQGSLVAGLALYARTPQEAVAYLAEYSPTCLNVRESGLQIMAVETIDNIDREWVAELERSMTAEALFTGNSSTQGILLAEYFIRKGNSVLQTILEKGGRGEYGGSDKEISRAAATSLFVASSGQWDERRRDNAYAYAESLLASPTTPSSVGSVLGGVLASNQTWPGGDSTPALTTLLLVLDDPRFKTRAASALFFKKKPEGPPGCNKALWDEIYAKVLAEATEQGWLNSKQ